MSNNNNAANFASVSESVKMRCYASVFSRGVIRDILRFDDYRAVDEIYSCFDKVSNPASTYLHYYTYIYRKLSKGYRCEYVYKNELISKYLLKQFGTRKTVYFNEFRVGETIADLAMFNGISKAFEIKTELDTPSRLQNQLSTYKRLFQKVYVVVPKERLDEYRLIVTPGVGLLTFDTKGGIHINEEVPAGDNEDFDSLLLMQCLREKEYMNIIRSKYGELPKVSAFEMYGACLKLLQEMPKDELRAMFLREMEQRKTATPLLRSTPSALRQICLSMNMNKKDCESLMRHLNVEIKI